MFELLRAIAWWWGRRPAWLRWIAVFAAIALVWWSSAQTPASTGASPWRALMHNSAHIVAFLGIAGLTLLALVGERLPGRRHGLIAIAVAALYGAIDELHQSTVPGRVSSLGDWVTDLCGALLAVAIVVWLHVPTVRNRRRTLAVLAAALAAACAATWLPI